MPELEMNITSINSLYEMLNSSNSIQKIYISQVRRGEKINQIKDLCRQKGIVFQIVPQGIIDRKTGGKNQGVFAQVSPVRFYKISEILENVTSGFILVLDRIHDTGNIGAIIRSAVAAQVDGIIVSLRKSAPINETVLKTSAGSLIKAKIVLSKNLTNDIRILKKNQFWVVATDVKRGIPYHQYDFKNRTAVIVGNEETGISPLVKKHADLLISIPYSGDVESLNVSVSAAVVLFEALRQKKSFQNEKQSKN
jgi:23S rRNA (guanosine2251-2'-O)-methyltransferase